MNPMRSVIWTVVKPMVDDVTRTKIFILRGKKAIQEGEYLNS